MLASALLSGYLGGDAFDVFEAEPLTIGAAQLFCEISNPILTPHIAGVTEDSNSRVSKMIADLVLDRMQ
ncbi:MAG TPA: NAD(P)-dependent oxidoreductase [Paracoccaceae bacterium]|nr:NAD(P)-dependent oxidoreductase [Paracoccaceae bacterium]